MVAAIGVAVVSTAKLPTAPTLKVAAFALERERRAAGRDG